jgi:hypothetical protein
MLIAFGAGAAASETAPHAERALAVAREVERLAAGRVLWPGYDPLAIPLAIFTGERTYLFRHPAPPPGFSPLHDAQPAAAAFAGRHPAVTSNSSADMGGTATATLLADGDRAKLGATELAAIALHEAFHVFQRQRHPGWAGNEADLFLYPADDARLLEKRRLESESLRRALDAPDAAGASCWSRLALGFRRERFAAMDAAFPRYERLTELNEGLAAYVQLIAAGQTTVGIPAQEFPATGVRDRVYAIGPALAFLLDRLRPGWPALLEADDKRSLDELLQAAVAEGPPGNCALAAGEVRRIRRTAREDAAAVVTARTARRHGFDVRPGWRVTVEAGAGRPLWPQGFDPLNVARVDGGLVHTRFLRLGNDGGELRAIDEERADLDCLTEAAGPHPLFNGIKRVTVAGLARPDVRVEGAAVSVSAPGLTAAFKNARARVGERDVVVELDPAPASPAAP